MPSIGTSIEYETGRASQRTVCVVQHPSGRETSQFTQKFTKLLVFALVWRAQVRQRPARRRAGGVQSACSATAVTAGVHVPVYGYTLTRLASGFGVYGRAISGRRRMLYAL